MQVSVIVVNYNTLSLTKHCIDSIFEQTRGVDFEIILVDNNSNDGSKYFFSNDSRIKYIYSEENLGFGRANNLGYEHTKGEFIFLLNSDTIVLNNALKIFYDFAKKSNENIACIGCLLLNDNNQITHSFDEFPSILNTTKAIIQLYFNFLNIKIFRNYENYKLRSKLPITVDYITGAAIVIKKSVIDKLGFFDPDFFMYYEESELQLRYKNAMYNSILIEGPLIIHIEGASQKKLNMRSEKQRLIYTASMFLYMKKKYNKTLYTLFRIVYFSIIPLIIFSKYSIKGKINLLNQVIRIKTISK